MRVLVICSNRLGATRGIPDCIATRLREARLDVTLQPASEAVPFRDAGTFVIGVAGHAVR